MIYVALQKSLHSISLYKYSSYGYVNINVINIPIQYEFAF